MSSATAPPPDPLAVVLPPRSAPGALRDPPPGARDSLRDAVDRERRGDTRGALELGLRGATVDRSAAVTLRVARWQLALGMYLAALANAEQCEREVQAVADMPRGEVLRVEAERTATEARTHTSVLTLIDEGMRPATSVRLDGEPVAARALGTPRRVAQGRHDVTLFWREAPTVTRCLHHPVEVEPEATMEARLSVRGVRVLVER